MTSHPHNKWLQSAVRPVNLSDNTSVCPDAKELAVVLEPNSNMGVKYTNTIDGEKPSDIQYSVLV